MKGGNIVIDESRWPKVIITWPKGEIDDEEFQRAVKHISELTARREHYVIVHDARLASRPSPKQRAFAAAEQQRTAEGAAEYLVGSAVVVSNALAAGAIRAINWISPPAYPQRVFSSLEEAHAWVDKQLR